MPSESIDVALTHLARYHSGQVLASLARRFNDLDLADEAVQEALIEASQKWPGAGVPENPGGWLYRVAQRKALDRLRRASAERRRVDRVAADLVEHNAPADDERSMLIDSRNDDGPLRDERLRLILLCCHPALAPDSQVALTLRLVGGLSTEEIAASFLVPTPTLAARITRAKKKIRTAKIPLSEPQHLSERLDAVLAVLYLIFNEGYLSRSGTGEPMRVDLCEESIRLSQVVAGLMPDHSEVHGLIALLGLTHARRDARFVNDEMVLLEDQDRSLWHLREIRNANAVLGYAVRLRQPGRYQLQALIASHHSNARRANDTDWTAIVALYDQLVATDPSPVVALNRAVSLAMADGPLTGLAALETIEGLDDYHLLHATKGELLSQNGDHQAARASLTRAHELASNPSERHHLATKLARLP